jgi:hypothetical protein
MASVLALFWWIQVAYRTTEQDGNTKIRTNIRPAAGSKTLLRRSDSARARQRIAGGFV